MKRKDVMTMGVFGSMGIIIVLCGILTQAGWPIIGLGAVMIVVAILTFLTRDWED